MKQVQDKRKLTPNAPCPWHKSPELKLDLSKHSNILKLTSRFSPVKRSSRDSVFSPIISPSTAPTFDRGNSALSTDRLLAYDETGRSSIKKSFDSTVYKTPEAYQSQVTYMQQYISYLKNKLQQYEENPIKTDTGNDLEYEIEYLKGIIKDKNQEANNYLDELCEKQDQIFKLTQKLSDFQEISQDRSLRKNDEIEQIENEVKKYYFKKINEYEYFLSELKIELEERNKEILKMTQQKTENNKEIRSLKESISEKIKGNENAFKDIEAKVQKAEDKLLTLNKTLRSLQNSSLLQISSKLKRQEEDLTSHYEKLLIEQKLETDKIKENLRKKIEELETLENSYQRSQKKIESQEETLKNERKANEDFARKKNELELELKKALVRFENEKLEKNLNFQKVQELSDSLNKTGEVAENLRLESQLLKEKLAESLKIGDAKENDISQKSSEISKLKSAISGKKMRSQEKKATIIEKDAKIQQVQDSNNRIQGALKDLSHEVRLKQIEIENLKLRESEKIEKISSLNKSQQDQLRLIEELNNNVKDLQFQILNKAKEGQKLLQNNYDQEIVIESLNSEKENFISLMNQKEADLQEVISKNSAFLSEIEQYKSQLEKAKKSTKKLEESLKIQAKNYQILADSKNNSDRELIESKALIKLLESRSAENLRIFNELQLKVQGFNKYIQEQDLTIENLRASIVKMNEEHESKIVSVNQTKIAELKEARSNYDKEKDIQLEKIQKLETFCLELNKDNSEKHEKILDLVTEFKYFKERSLENEINMTKTQYMLTEEINYLKKIESKLNGDLSKVNKLNEELKEHLLICEKEIIKIKNEKVEILDMLNEKENIFIASVRKNEELVDQFEYIIENNAQSIAELQLSKKQLIDKCNLAIQESETHEKELLNHIENLQTNIHNLQETINKKNAEIQAKEKIFAKTEFELKSEIENLSKKIKENENEILNLNKSISQEKSIEKSLKSEISELKNKAFENERTAQKTKSDLGSLKEKILDKDKLEDILKEKIKTSEEKIQKLKEVNESLLDHLDKTQKALDESVEDSLQKTEKLKKEIQKTEKKLFESESRSQNLKDQIEKLTGEILTEKKEKIELEIRYKEKVSELERENKDSEGKIQNLEGQNTKAKNDNFELKNNLTILDSKIRNISKELEKSQENLEKAFQSEKEKEKILENKISGYEASIENLKSSHKQQLSSLHSEIAELDSGIKQKDRQIKNLNLELESLQSAEQILKAEVSQLQEKIEKDERVNKILSDSKSKELEKLEKQVFDIREQFLSAAEQKASEEIANFSLRELNRENEKVLKSLLEALKVNERTIKNLELKNSELLSTVRILHSELNSEKQLKKQAEDALEQKKRDLKSLVDDIDQIKKAYENDLFDLENKVTDEKQKNQKFEIGLIKKHEELERILLELDSLKVKMVQSENDLEKLNLILNQEKNKNCEIEKTLKNEIDVLNKEKNQITQLFESASNELENSTKKSELLKSEKEEIKKGQEQSRRENRYLKETLDKTQKKNEILLEKLNKYKETSSKLKQETESLAVQLKNQEKIVKGKETEELDLKSIIISNEDSLKSQSHLINKLKTDSNLLEQKILNLEIIADQQLSYKQKINSLQAHLANKDSINRDLQKECILITQEKQKITENLTENFKIIQKENEVLSHSLKNAESQLDFHQKMQKHSEAKSENLIEQLRSELELKTAGLETIKQKLNSTSRKYEDLLDDFPEADHGKLRVLYKNFKNSGRQIIEPEVVESEIKKLKNLLDCAKAELVYLKNENSKLRECLTSSDLEKSRIDSLRIKEVKFAEDEIRQTRLVFSEVKLENHSLSQKNQELQRNSEDLEAKLRALTSDKSSLKEKLEGLNDSFRQMTIEKDKLIIQKTEEVSDLKEKLLNIKENYSNDKASLTEELNKNLAKSSNLNGELESLKSQVNTLEKKLETKSSDYEGLLLNYNTFKTSSKSKKNSLKSAFSNSNNSLISLKDSHNTLTQNHEVLKTELEALQSSQSDQQLLISQLLKEKSDLESLLSDFKKILEESGAFDIQQLREIVVQLQTQKILDSRDLIKNGQTIKKLEEKNMQKMNSYKINILQFELDQKNKKIEEMKEEHFNSLAGYMQAVSRQDRGLSEIESILKSRLSEKLDQEAISEIFAGVLKVISTSRTN